MFGVCCCFFSIIISGTCINGKLDAIRLYRKAKSVLLICLCDDRVMCVIMAWNACEGGPKEEQATSVVSVDFVFMLDVRVVVRYSAEGLAPSEALICCESEHMRRVPLAHGRFPPYIFRTAPAFLLPLRERKRTVNSNRMQIHT